MSTKEIYIRDAFMVDDSGEVWKLHYFVRALEGETTAYGIKIEMLSKTLSGGRLEWETAQGLTHSYEEAEGWAKVLAAGKVTPTALHEVVHDLQGVLC